MKFFVAVCVLAVAAALPEKYPDSHSEDHIKILRDDRFHPEDGTYSFDFETENGIVRSESGDKLENIENEPVGQQGSYSFSHPNGEEFSLKFVANEHGFQPESDALPVAPAFPHPIPQFVLDQIAKAAREDEEARRSGNQQTYN